MQWREKRRERAWEQSEGRKDPVVSRVGRGGKSVWLLLVLSSWWGNMSLTPPLLLCTENITENMRVLKTGGENLIWKMHIMDSRAAWTRKFLFVSALGAWIYPWIYSSYMFSCSSNGNHVCKCVCMRAQIKYGRSSSPNYNSDVSLEFWEQAVQHSTSNAFSSHTQTLPRDGRSESSVTSWTSKEFEEPRFYHCRTVEILNLSCRSGCGYRSVILIKVFLWLIFNIYIFGHAHGYDIN